VHNGRDRLRFSWSALEVILPLSGGQRLQTKLQTNCTAQSGIRYHSIGSSHEKCQTRAHG
jgi:hypothetical protein